MHDWDDAEHVRQRLAHRLHDGAIQELTAAQLFLDGVSMRMQQAEVDTNIREGLERGLTALRNATLECRLLMDNLRPGLDGEGELEERLERLVWEHSPGASVQVDVPGKREPTAVLMAYRVAEELLSDAHQRGVSIIALKLHEDEEGAGLVLAMVLRADIPIPTKFPSAWQRAGITPTGDRAVWRAVIPPQSTD